MLQCEVTGDGAALRQADQIGAGNAMGVEQRQQIIRVAVGLVGRRGGLAEAAQIIAKQGQAGRELRPDPIPIRAAPAKAVEEHGWRGWPLRVAARFPGDADAGQLGFEGSHPARF